MTSPQQRKGDRWELALLAALDALGLDVHRTKNAGVPADMGDLHTRTIAVQAKDVKSKSLGAWVDETTAQAARAQRLPAVAVKGAGLGAADGFMVIPTWAWAELVKRAVGER